MSDSMDLERYTCKFDEVALEIGICCGAVVSVGLAGSCIGWNGSFKNSTTASLVVEELGEYFSGKRKDFTFPISPGGTQFQRLVWDELKKIPYGETRSYSDVAESIGCRNSARAVGMACKRNPILIIIPCHRVIGSDGNLGGYAGGTDMKKYLLNLERGVTIGENIGRADVEQ